MVKTDSPEKKLGRLPQIALGVLRRWWVVCTPVGLLLAACAAAVVYYTFVPVFKSESWLRMYDSSPYVAFKESARSGNFISTQLQLLKSPMVLERALRDPKVRRIPAVSQATDQTAWLSKNISIRRLGRSELYKLGYTNEDPKTAQIISNAVSRAFMAEYENTGDKENERLIRLLDEIGNDFKSRLEQQREKLKKMTAEWKGTPIERADDKIQVMHPLQSLEEDLINATVQLESMKIEQERIKMLTEKADPIVVSDDAVAAQLTAHPKYLRKQELNVRREQLMATASPKILKKELAIIDSELKTLETDLANLHQEQKAAIKEQAEASRKKLVTDLERRIETQERTVAMYDEKYKEKLREAHKGNSEAWELQFQQSTVAREQRVFDLIAERAFVLRTELSAPAQVRLLRDAGLPLQPVEKIPLKKMGLFGGAAFVFPFALAFLWDLLTRRLTTADDIRSLNLPVLGEIAVLPKVSRKVNSKSSELSLFRESIDSLRTGLVLSNDIGDLQVLSVTSATKSEGKTSVASQLAISIARASQQPTLLIDGDMRRPDIHEIFSVDISPGLADVLSGRTSSLEAQAWSEFLDVVPSGILHENPHKLVTQEAVETLLAELRKKYHYIIIDTPPVLSASESLVLSRNADATIVATMRDLSRSDQLSACYERLLKAGANPVGTVLSAVPTSRYSYYYGHYDSRPRRRTARTAS